MAAYDQYQYSQYPPPPPPPCQNGYAPLNGQTWNVPPNPYGQYASHPQPSHQTIAPLPSSQAELRQRLESVGVSPEQITAVLTQGPSPASSQDKITFHIRNNSKNKYIITSSDPAPHHHLPTYDAAFTPRFLHHNPQLQIHRQASSPSPIQICHCTYHHLLSDKISLQYPWATKDKWLPESQTWNSDVGTLNGRAMRWEYGYVESTPTTGQPRAAAGVSEEFIIRCAAEEGDMEICRVVLAGGLKHQKQRKREGRIELARGVFGQCTVEQRDEMVGNAVVQAVRKWEGYTEEEDGDSEEEDEGDVDVAGALQNVVSFATGGA